MSKVVSAKDMIKDFSVQSVEPMEEIMVKFMMESMIEYMV